jgi:hypothetical protein
MALAGGLARDVDGQENTLKPTPFGKSGKTAADGFAFCAQRRGPCLNFFALSQVERRRAVTST